MDEVETVKVVVPVSAENSQGFIIINKTDLTDAHVVFGDAATVEKPRSKKQKE